MKVLQINCVYEKGSTGKITYVLHKGLLDAGIESVVCYGRGASVKQIAVYKTCSEWYSKLNNALSRFTGIMYGGCFFSTNKLISIIRNEKPDIVHLQCINGYFVNIYRLITWLKQNHVKTVLTLHAEFMYTANCGHALDCERWKKGCGRCPRKKEETKSLFLDGTATSWNHMKKAFEGFENDLTVVSVSPWLMDRAKQSPFLENMRQCVIFNGLDTNVFHPYDTRRLREKYHCEDKKIIFHASPSFNANPEHIKGGYYVIELAKIMPDFQFIVAGECSGKLETPANMVLLGKITDQKLLAQYYSMADVTLLTSKRETFSMVCAESLCCGTPVVGFKAGAPEQISLPEHSHFVEYGNLDGLRMNIVNLNRSNKQCISKCADGVYSKNVMVVNYISLYKTLSRK